MGLAWSPSQFVSFPSTPSTFIFLLLFHFLLYLCCWSKRRRRVKQLCFARCALCQRAILSFLRGQKPVRVSKESCLNVEGVCVWTKPVLKKWVVQERVGSWMLLIWGFFCFLRVICFASSLKYESARKVYCQLLAGRKSEQAMRANWSSTLISDAERKSKVWRLRNKKIKFLQCSSLGPLSFSCCAFLSSVRPFECGQICKLQQATGSGGALVKRLGLNGAPPVWATRFLPLTDRTKRWQRSMENSYGGLQRPGGGKVLATAWWPNGQIHLPDPN